MEYLSHKGQNNYKVDGIYFAFSWQWREWCGENREYEVIVAAHNEPMQRQLTAGAADTSGRSLQDGASRCRSNTAAGQLALGLGSLLVNPPPEMRELHIRHIRK